MNATFKNYSISAEYLGDKPAPWSDKDREQNYNRHRVIVRNRTSGKRVSFYFWASLAQPELRSPSDLRGAFECFLSDAIAGKQSFEDFCGDFGYDADSRKAEQAWKACSKASDKADRLIDGDLYGTANALRELESA
jgi:hypothetical protein